MSAVPHIEPWMVTFANLEHHVENALQYSGGTHDVEDVFQGILAGQFQMWAGEDSIIITEILEYPKLRGLHFFLVGGNLEELQEMEMTVIDWARANGCARATTAGRVGWSRTFLKDRGYVPQWHVMCRELNNE